MYWAWARTPSPPRKVAEEERSSKGALRMRIRLVSSFIVSVGVLLAQGRGPGIMAHNPANENKPYDKHDLSGIWTRNGTPAGYGGGGVCRDCRHRDYSKDVSPLTPLGQKMYEANKPSYGRNLGSKEADAQPEEAIGRRRAVPP